ncbi:hypothetical protein ABT112_34910 [Streptomyces sp. NPDC002055]|uniref:hypothetical protein n=1 Tax=Streptomyces sp. NPDC002055 TaxID=3154534 RepID=UPI0033212F13
MISHETVNSILKGASFPRWSKLEVVVRVLGRWSVTQPDEQALVLRFHGMWEAASNPASPQMVSRGNSGSPVAPPLVERSRDARKERHLASLRGEEGQGTVVLNGLDSEVDGELFTVSSLAGRTMIRLNTAHPVIGELFSIPEDLESLPQADLAVMLESVKDSLDILFLSWGAAHSRAGARSIEFVDAFNKEWSRLAYRFFGEMQQRNFSE